VEPVAIAVWFLLIAVVTLLTTIGMLPNGDDSYLQLILSVFLRFDKLLKTLSYNYALYSPGVETPGDRLKPVKTGS
jgi:hypothetical protein